MAAPVLVVTANLGPDAVPYSGGNAPVTSYAKSSANSLPGAILCASQVVAVATATATPLPAAVFAAGSGVYTVFCDVVGTTGNDICATGWVNIVAGAIADSKGFVAQQRGDPVYNGAGPTVTQTVSSLQEVGAVGSYVPNLFQTSGGALNYTVTAIKQSNYPTAFLPGGTV